MSLSVWAAREVFSTDALSLLLHSPLTVHGAKRGKTSFSLVDLLDLAPAKAKGNASRFVKASTPRDHARWDIHLREEWVSQMREVNVAFAQACEMAHRIQKQQCTSKSTVAWHAMIVRPGSPDQNVHVDDKQFRVGGKRCYYTLIIPLSSDPEAGGTHFPTLGHTFCDYGGALMFDGSVQHAGLGNRSWGDRIFLYAAIHSGKDEN